VAWAAALSVDHLVCWCRVQTSKIVNESQELWSLVLLSGANISMTRTAPETLKAMVNPGAVRNLHIWLLPTMAHVHQDRIRAPLHNAV
jgi:hypothetical protein